MNVIQRALIVVSVSVSGAMALVAQEQGEAQPSVLEGVYTEAQAERGHTVYEDRCTLCHASDQFTGAVFKTWVGGSVGRLYSLIRGTMPEEDPGGLADAEYADLVAYLLRINGYPAGDGELPPDRALLNRIRLEDRSD